MQPSFYNIFESIPIRAIWTKRSSIQIHNNKPHISSIFLSFLHALSHFYNKEKRPAKNGLVLPFFSLLSLFLHASSKTKGKEEKDSRKKVISLSKKKGRRNEKAHWIAVIGIWNSRLYWEEWENEFNFKKSFRWWVSFIFSSYIGIYVHLRNRLVKRTLYQHTQNDDGDDVV